MQATAQTEKIEPILLLLTGLIIFFACMLVFVEKFFASDGQVFQVISNILSGIAGAFIMRIKPPSQHQGDTIKAGDNTTVNVPAPVAAPEPKVTE